MQSIQIIFKDITFFRTGQGRLWLNKNNFFNATCRIHTDAFHFLPYDYTEKSSYEKSNEILPLHVAKPSKLNSIFA